MPWFKRAKKGILTPTADKREVPDGLWSKSPKGTIIHTKELKKNAYVIPKENYHVRIGSKEYFDILFDNQKFVELDATMESTDPLQFVDNHSYSKRLKEHQHKTSLKDAIRCAHGKVDGHPMTIAAMDFQFIGGSMGSVVGEKIARAIRHTITTRHPLLIISKSGGARMMEAGFSLMQMAKTAAQLALLNKEDIPYISLLTDPTTGGVTASFAMLGDFNIAEPEALIGFAGPRVIRETIGKKLPKGFQKAEFLLEHGFIDCIVDRRDLKKTLSSLLVMLQSDNLHNNESL